MPEAYIYDHVRTPRGRGKADGSLHEVTALALATVPLQALKERNNLAVDVVDDVVLGVVDPVGEAGSDIARFAALKAGLGQAVPGVQISRFSDLHDRQHVGAHGIADHEEACRVDAVTAKDGRVDIGGLVADDLDVVKVLAQARPVELGRLVQQVALGHEHQRVGRGQRDRLSRASANTSICSLSMSRAIAITRLRSAPGTRPPVRSTAVSISESAKLETP